MKPAELSVGDQVMKKVIPQEGPWKGNSVELFHIMENCTTLSVELQNMNTQADVDQIQYSSFFMAQWKIIARKIK